MLASLALLDRFYPCLLAINNDLLEFKSAPALLLQNLAGQLIIRPENPVALDP